VWWGRRAWQAGPACQRDRERRGKRSRRWAGGRESGPCARGRKKGAGEKDCWLGRAAKREEGEGRGAAAGLPGDKKKGRGGEVVSWAGPIGEERERETKRRKTNAFEFPTKIWTQKKDNHNINAKSMRCTNIWFSLYLFLYFEKLFIKIL
jgi:hypothetical protein